MARFPYLTYFSHVLPLDYELSLTPYEILSKLLKWLDGLTGNVNSNSAAIADLQAKVKELMDKGFTNDQLREVLYEMVADGEFDFLVDLITAETELWDIVGLKPYAQVLPEMVNEPIAGYSFQSMAMGGGSYATPMIGCFCFSHRTGTVLDGSLIILINLVTGLVVGYNKTFIGAVNSCGYNPNDGHFYIVSGGDSTQITVINVDPSASIVKTITTDEPSYKAGGITFKADGNAIITWYAIDGSDASIVISEYSNLEIKTVVHSVAGTVKSNTWVRPYIYSVGRQDIYCDDVYLYLPTYWHAHSDDNWTTYNKQDVFTLSNLEYIRTQQIDCRNEIESGCYDGFDYFMAVNISQSAYLFRASVKADNEYNSAYINLSQLSNTEFNYGPYTLYGNGTAVEFLADGTADHPINRLTVLQLISMPFARYTGIKYLLTGDFTSDGQIITMSFRNSIQRLIIEGYNTCILPKLTFDNCSRVTLTDLTIRGYDTNYIVYFFDTKVAVLRNIKFTNAVPDQTINSVIRVENTNLTVDNSRILDVVGKIGYDGTLPTYYVNTLYGGRVSGNFYRDYEITGSGTYITMGEFSFVRAANLSGNVLALMTDNGLHVTGQLTAGANFAANAELLSLPADNRQSLTSLVKERGAGAYLTAAADDAALALYFDYTTNKITTLGAITSGTTIYINDLIPLESVKV